jgi:hypothetical protein
MKNHWLSGGQIRAARALLRWGVEQLARKASLGRNTIKRAEAKDGKTSLTGANELAIRRALEGAGVEFTNGNQPGIRLTKAAAARKCRADRPPCHHHHLAVHAREAQPRCGSRLAAPIAHGL